MYGQVSLIDGQTTIAGILLQSTAPTQNDNAEVKTAQAAEETMSLILNAPKLTIVNSEIALQYEDLVLPIKINHFVLDETLARTEKQSTALALDLSIHQAKLHLTAKMNMFAGEGDITTTLDIQNFALSTIAPLLPTEIESLVGDISLKSEQIISITNDLSKVNLSALNFSLNEFNIISDKAQASILNKSINLTNIAIEIPINEPMIVSGNGQVKLENIVVANKTNNAQTVLSIKDVNIDEFSIVTNESLPEVFIPVILINQLITSQDSSTEFKPLAQFSQLVINNIQQGVSDSVEAMTKGAVNMENGIQSVNLSASAMQEINEATLLISEINQHISVTTQQQKIMSNIISEETVEVGELASVTLDGTQESLDINMELSHLSKQLKELIKKFKS